MEIGEKEKEFLRQVLLAVYQKVQGRSEVPPFGRFSEAAHRETSESRAFSAWRNQLGRYVGGGFKAQDFAPFTDSCTKKLLYAAEELLGQCVEAGVKPLTIFDAAYPFGLKQLSDPPLVLFARSKCLSGLLASGPTVAIVGSRRATRYGLSVTAEIARQLSLSGVRIISGLAKGIDGAAHKAAPNGVAVLGSGVLNIYPEEHEGLARLMVEEGGTILSEYGLTSYPRSERFPERNRLVSAFSDVILVVEAAERSGALITARLGGEQGKEVCAVPGPVTSATSRGSNRLISAGAMVVSSADDILQLLESRGLMRAIVEADPFEQLDKMEKEGSNRSSSIDLAPLSENLVSPPERITQIGHLLSDGYPRNLDDLVEATGLNSSELFGVLSELELVGAIRVLEGQRYTHDCYVDRPRFFEQFSASPIGTSNL